MSPEVIAQIRALRRKGWSAAGIARHTGATESEIAEVLGEGHLLAAGGAQERPAKVSGRRR